MICKISASSWSLLSRVLQISLQTRKWCILMVHQKVCLGWYARKVNTRSWLFQRSLGFWWNNDLSDSDMEWIMKEEENETCLLCYGAEAAAAAPWRARNHQDEPSLWRGRVVDQAGQRAQSGRAVLVGKGPFNCLRNLQAVHLLAHLLPQENVFRVCQAAQWTRRGRHRQGNIKCSPWRISSK